MFLSRILFLVLSLSILASCSVPVFKDQDMGINSGVTDSQKTGSTLVNQTIQTGSANIVVPSMIDKNPIEDTIIKIAPVIVNKNTVDESEKDDCEKIYQSDTDQQNCIDNFFIKKAITSKDESICSMVSSIVLQDNCKDNVLFQEISTKNDPTLCTQLRNLDTVGNCFAIVGKQAQINNTTEGNNNDPCKGIDDNDVKSACTEGLIFNEAVRLRDTAMCKTLKNQMKQGMCANLIKSILDNSNTPK